MNAYKTDPQLALTTLEKIAEEIPSGVSSRDVGETITRLGRHPCEIAENVNKSIALELTNELKTFWQTYNVTNKLERVKDLNATSFGIFKNEILNASDAKYLKLLKESLQTRLEKIREENVKIEETLRAKSHLVKKQLEEVKMCDFRV